MSRANDAAAAATVVFEDVNVVPMDLERVLPHQDLVVRDGRIAALGPSGSIAIPRGAERVSATRRYLLPGLGEMHAHLPSQEMPESTAANLLYLYVANGVTTVRGMQGDRSQIELRERIRRGDLPGPRLILGSPAMYGRNVQDPAQAAQQVREYRSAGFDLIKVHEGLTPEVYDAVAGTARALGIPFAGHVSKAVGLMHALNAGQSTVDHLDGYLEALVPEHRAAADASGFAGVGKLIDEIDEARIASVVEATHRRGAAVVPTLVVWEEGLFPTRTLPEMQQARPEIRYVSPAMLAEWTQIFVRRSAETSPEVNRRVGALRRRLLLALHQGGVRILLGADSPQVFNVPGFSLHREMQAYVAAGISPYEVLSSGTRLIAEHLGIAGDQGTIAVGKIADLVLVEGNPLEAIENVERIAGVMIRGQWLDRDRIDAALKRIAEAP